jgi:hypothetical protein
MDMSAYSLSLPPTAGVSRTKNSAQRKRRKTRSKRAGKFTSCAVGSGEKIIKGIRPSVINEVDNDSMKGDEDNKRNETDNETANGDKEMSIGGSGFSLHSLGYNCEGGIVLNIHSNNIREGVYESTGQVGCLVPGRSTQLLSTMHA